MPLLLFATGLFAFDSQPTKKASPAISQFRSQDACFLERLYDIVIS